jgi:hypothetical protein
LFWCLQSCALQRGLFERHKLLFALMLTNKILVSAGKVKPQDVDILLKGGGALDITSVSVLAMHNHPWVAIGGLPTVALNVATMYATSVCSIALCRVSLHWLRWKL